MVRAAAKFAIAAYLNVPVYAAFHQWLGRGDQLQGMWDAWKAGDRKAALAEIPDQVFETTTVPPGPETTSPAPSDTAAPTQTAPPTATTLPSVTADQNVFGVVPDKNVTC